MSVILCQAVRKNNSVSGRPARWLKKVRLETFFFIFEKKNILFQKIYNIFMEKKKNGKKKIAAGRLALILATRCRGNRFFFMDSLNFPTHAMIMLLYPHRL